MDKLIRMESIKKHYEMPGFVVRALDGVDISVGKGEFISLVGPSGSGKTTLLNVLGGLDITTSGTYFFKTSKLSSMPERELAKVRNREFGFVFQSFNLISNMSALENVALPGKYRKLSSKECKIMAKAALSKVGLADRLSHLPRELSGGQQQRVAFARALLCEPSVLFADEPTGNLDSKTGLEILELLESLNNRGTTIIMVTHDKNIAQRAKRSIFLKDGRIISDTESTRSIS